VHVLDPAGAQVVAQRDAEPRDGHAPTTGWVVGEVSDDYVITPGPPLSRQGISIEIASMTPLRRSPPPPETATAASFLSAHLRIRRDLGTRSGCACSETWPADGAPAR